MLVKKIHDRDLKWLISKIGGCDFDKGPWIAGGAARRLWFDDDWRAGDVDFFFPNETIFSTAKEKCTHLKIWDKMTFNPQPQHVYSSKNAETYHVQIGRLSSTIATVQLIKNSWHTDIHELLNGFDFTVCMFACDGDNVYCYQTAVDDCNAGLLKRTCHSTKPVKIRRVIKYNLYGFLADKEIYNELAEQYKDKTLWQGEDDVDYD
jgi:hypothetical protein